MNRESPSRTSSPVRSGRPESGRPLTNSDMSPSTASRVNSPASTARMRQPRWPGDASSGEGMIRPWARTYAVPASTPLTATSSMAAHSSRSAGNGQPRACIHRDFKGDGGVSLVESHPRGAAPTPACGRATTRRASGPEGFWSSFYLSKITGASRHSRRNRHVQTGRNGGDGERGYGRGDRCRRGHTERTRNDRGLIWHRRAENQPRRDRRRPSNVPHDPLPPSCLACLSLEQWVCPGIWTDTREDFRRISTCCRPRRRRQAIRSVSGRSRSVSSGLSRPLALRL